MPVRRQESGLPERELKPHPCRARRARAEEARILEVTAGFFIGRLVHRRFAVLARRTPFADRKQFE
jgi:hypothetical protein